MAQQTQITPRLARLYVDCMEREWGNGPAIVTAWRAYMDDGVAMVDIETASGNGWTVVIEPDGYVYGEC